MSFSQLYTSSLQQGVVDGQENPLYVLTQEKFYKVQDYVVLTRHIYDPMPVIASKKWLDSLPEDLQSIVTEAMVEVTQYEREIAFLAIMVYVGTKLALHNMKQLSPALCMPIGWVYAALPTGCLLIAVRLVLGLFGTEPRREADPTI